MALYTNPFLILATSAAVIACLIYQIKLPATPRQATDDFLQDLDIVGHRAGGYDAPENSLEAIRMAKKNGAAGIEIDLAFSKDDAGVLMHDPSLGRTTNGPNVDVDQLTLKQLKALNVTVNERLKNRFDEVKIPTIEEALKEAKRLKLKVIVDVKGEATKTADALIPLFEKYNLYKEAIVTSFNPLVVYKVRRRNPRIIGGIIYFSYFVTDFLQRRNRSATIIKLATLLDTFIYWSFYSWAVPMTGSSIVSIHKDIISSEELHYWNSRGISVMTWTVNSKIQKQYFNQYLKIPYMTDCIRKEDDCSR
ncbi:Glycerophosphodiester phosphodiesterase 1 [Trichoplax sp. H2]|uniref:GP-PDE domain-containing protein n=1 Tax=Trichoplax adhaerens TaxID=10228 RepID=B3RMT9_TRIAD|nr:hypothetical protein TRIADDRAFT_52925 [Trichoplax adhaerens]EDV27908.1 hypothetical protein TRIADDRAFT_52925 [Trichoplax adhaerens]RDD43979.1 Glycerophosphodiester phosphodiesterase 1 [Trichoplax sp. H2]|eukprot:XP_002109742.1 hypothetical protein TRIADDRAFT_52925 [Trichoplax adhaerens]